jgi:hypothetical protein
VREVIGRRPARVGASTMHTHSVMVGGVVRKQLTNVPGQASNLPTSRLRKIPCRCIATWQMVANAGMTASVRSLDHVAAAARSA